MRSQMLRAMVAGLLLAAASAGAYMLTPTKRMADTKQSQAYEQLIPRQFGDWVEDRQVAAPVINPQQAELLNSLYSETVSRTYIDRKTGRRIMLSVAYGGDQSRGSQIHKPEVCYPAQGFSIASKRKDAIVGSVKEIPVMRLVAKQGRREEPVTYWIRVGGSVVRGALEQNFARVEYGLQGYIPDGLLFRVSEISSDYEASFSLQDRFVRDLLLSLSPDAQRKIVGDISPVGSGK